MGSDSAHQDIVTAVIHLCSDSITQFEGILNAQIESDKAAFEEMEKAKEKARFAEQAAKEAAAEAARYAAEHAKKERERLAAMAHDVPTTTFTNRTWSATLDMGDDDDNESENDEEEEDGNDSAGEEVRFLSFHSFILHSQHRIIILGD
jgi:ATPase subunit of ABC transporter with duplicated ATPase domains